MKIMIIKIVKLNKTFSQPLFSVLELDKRLELDSVSPLDWRKIKTANRIERIIWITIRIVFIL